jgi:hypothetical protein
LAMDNSRNAKYVRNLQAQEDPFGACFAVTSNYYMHNSTPKGVVFYANVLVPRKELS